MSKFIPSSKHHPCPVCGRDKDQDCRSLEQDNVVLCHTQINNPGSLINGYQWLRPSKDGLWGVFVWDDRNTKGQIKGRKIQRTQSREEYFYPDRNGNPLVKVQRVPKGDEKDFYQYHWNGSEWIPSIPNEIRSQIPVYRYAEVREAIATGQPVLMVEGEGVANALWSLGIAATTTIGGSKKYRSYGTDYKSDLDSATLILCPDRDKLGVAHMEDISNDFPDAQWLKVYPRSPIWDHLPDVGGLDLEDWINDGAGIEEIFGAISRETEKPKTEPKLSYHDTLDIIDQLEDVYSDDAELEWNIRIFAHENKLTSKGFAGDTLLRLARARRDGQKAINVQDAHAILNKYQEGRKWLVAGLVPLGSTIVFSASGGSGKTTKLYGLAKHFALGQSWSGLPVMQCKSLIVQADEPEVDIADKLDSIDFHLVPEGSVSFINDWRFTQIRQLEQIIRKGKYKFIVIDSYTAAHAGMGVELTKSSAGDSIYKLRNIAQELECTIVIVHHHNKGDDMRDSTTIRDNASEIWMMKKDRENENLGKNDWILEIPKSRSGLVGKYILTRNPVDYSWTFGGSIDEEDCHIDSVKRLLERYPDRRFNAYEVSNEINVSMDAARATLEKCRRIGIIRSEWVLYIKEGQQVRYRQYFSLQGILPNKEVESASINESEPEEVETFF